MLHSHMYSESPSFLLKHWGLEGASHVDPEKEQISKWPNCINFNNSWTGLVQFLFYRKKTSSAAAVNHFYCTLWHSKYHITLIAVERKLNHEGPTTRLHRALSPDSICRWKPHDADKLTNILKQILVWWKKNLHFHTSHYRSSDTRRWHDGPW